MSRPDPIEYAERLYGAIRAANFSPLSFLAFGNAVKDGVGMRNMPRIAAEPFMRVVGEMLALEQDIAEDGVVDATIVESSSPDPSDSIETPTSAPEERATASAGKDGEKSTAVAANERRRAKR